MNQFTSFENLVRHYQYDTSLPMEAELAEQGKIDGGTSYKLKYKSVDGMTVSGNILVPQSSGPWPLMIAPPYMGGSDLPRQGILTAWIEYRNERLNQIGLKESYSETPTLILWSRIHTILDFRRLLDLTFTKFPVDPEKVCYQGASKGAMMGAILGAVDKRIRQFVLRAGGANWASWVRASEDERFIKLRGKPWYSDEFINILMAPYDAQHFVGKLSPRPVLFQFGRRDNVIGMPAFENMVSYAGEPKTIIWYDAGHGMVDAKHQPMVDAREWLAEQWERPEILANDPHIWPSNWRY